MSASRTCGRSPLGHLHAGPAHLSVCFPAGRASLVRVTDLRLEDLRLQDGGAYECRILLLDEATDELQNATWTQLSVTGEVYQVDSDVVEI